jgi:hypothetical protein
VSKFKETKKVLSFMKSPDNMPKSGAKLEETNIAIDPEILMEDILDAQPITGKKRKKTKKKKAEPESEFPVGMESTTAGSY